MSDTNQPYDPNAPEGEAQRGGNYVSKKDFRVIAIGILALAIMLVPVYKVLERNSQKARCAQNMKAIASAVHEYASLHDDRFPPIMRTLPNDSPDLADTGLPYTWVSDVQEHMNPRANFLCPSASPDEIVYSEGRNATKIPLTYGMFAPYGGYLRSIIDNPDQTVIIAETSNFGADGTYNPLPFEDLDGNKIPHDGFSIGFNDSNFMGSATSKYVTRLAFPDSSKGTWSKDDSARHDAGIHGITAGGGASPLLKPNDAKITTRFGLPGGLWTVPPVSKRSR